MNKILTTLLALTLAAICHGADKLERATHSLVYGSSITAEIEPCG